MVLNDVFDRFAQKTPVSVMARAMMENVFKPESLDSIFEENAQQQYAGDLLFSTVADVICTF